MSFEELVLRARVRARALARHLKKTRHSHAKPMLHSRCIYFKKRLYLTLIEVMIVIAIVVLVTGVIGINMRGALIAQQFRSEVDVLVDTIRLAQDLMLVLGKDTHLWIKGSPDGRGIVYRLEVEGGAPEGWDPIIQRSWKQMQSTHFVDFDKQDDFPSKLGEIDLRFQSTGAMMSKGVLRLATHENPYLPQALRRAICLKGYPHPLQSVQVSEIPPRDQQWIVCKDKQETEGFFERLTFDTVGEVLQDVPPREAAPSKDEQKDPSQPPQQPLPQEQ